MKRLLILAAALAIAAGGVSAQEWKEALKRAATTAADKLTEGKLTEYALRGTWNYTGPGVKFESGDLLAEAGGAVLESTIVSKLEKAYALAGIRPGACSFTFNDDDTFTATFGAHTLKGTYEYTAATHVVALKFDRDKLGLGSLSGHAYISGNELQLVFPITKLVGLVTTLGSKVSSLQTIAKLLDKYENVYIGFAFGK